MEFLARLPTMYPTSKVVMSTPPHACVALPAPSQRLRLSGRSGNLWGRWPHFGAGCLRDAEASALQLESRRLPAVEPVETGRKLLRRAHAQDGIAHDGDRPTSVPGQPVERTAPCNTLDPLAPFLL